MRDFFPPRLAKLNLVGIWFYQDCDTCHTTRKANDMLKDEFDDNLLKRPCELATQIIPFNSS